MAAVSLNSNLAALRATRALNASSAELSSTLERLSSGKRINRASDDAASLAIASKLGVDARVFTQGVRNLNDGISFLNVADGATSALKDILFRMRELATQSSNGVLGDTQRSALGDETQSLMKEYNRIIATASFNGIQVLSSASQQLVLQGGYGSDGREVISLKTGTIFTPDGTFGAPIMQTFANPGSEFAATLVVGDVNGDGRSDFITAGAQFDWRAHVFLGNGNGTFAAGQVMPGANQGSSIASGDFNGDGKLDFSIGDASASQTNVFIGNGDGTFDAAVGFATGSHPYVAVADANGDGKGDLITVDRWSDGASVLIGNGNGTFQARQSFSTGAGSGPIWVSVGDMDGDGKLDLVTADYGTSTVGVLLGNGNGTFEAVTSYSIGASFLTLKDVNGDSKLDVIRSWDSGTIGVSLGNGDGTLAACLPVSAGQESYTNAVGDFNGDGKPDIVNSNYTPGTVSVSFGNGDGRFQAAHAYAVVPPGGYYNFAVAIGDFNGDAVSDFAGADLNAGVGILLGNGISQAVGLTPLSNISVATRTDALAAQDSIDSYLSCVSTFEGTIGAGLSRLQVARENLSAGSENFSEASSHILDADVADESAQLIRQQILQQATTAVLAQANQQPASALQLLNVKS